MHCGVILAVSLAQAKLMLMRAIVAVEAYLLK
jgi:hypothetical protein